MSAARAECGARHEGSGYVCTLQPHAGEHEAWGYTSRIVAWNEEPAVIPLLPPAVTPPSAVLVVPSGRGIPKIGRQRFRHLDNCACTMCRAPSLDLAVSGAPSDCPPLSPAAP